MRLRRSASSVLISRPAASSAPRACSYFQCAGAKFFFGSGHNEATFLAQPGAMPI
jgi:hypothetical protein